MRILDAVEVVPELGYHLTLYDSDAQGFDQRGMVTGRLDLRTRLRREFAPSFISRPVAHVIEPFVSWGIVQSAQQRSNPFYLPDTALQQERIRLLDLDNVVGDPADRVDRFHGLTVGVRQQLMGRSLGTREDPETGETIYVSEASRLVADVTVAYDYQIWGNRLGNFVVDGAWWPWNSWTSRVPRELRHEPQRDRRGLPELRLLEPERAQPLRAVPARGRHPAVLRGVPHGAATASTTSRTISAR